MAIKKGSYGEAMSFNVLLALSFSHFINDMLQSLLFSIYPILKASFSLNFTEIGLITMAYQLTASLLQPIIGLYTDKRPKHYSLPFGMMLTLTGLIMLSLADNFIAILISSALIGTGSAIFHPEGSRMVRVASGGRHGFAQSFFQVGGNAGTAFGPLLAAYLILPRGQSSICWFSIDAVLAIGFLIFVSRWHKITRILNGAKTTAIPHNKVALPRKKIIVSIIILLLLVFSKYFYLASINNYYIFYLIEKFSISVHDAQMCLFVFLGSVALGTFFGGPIGDKIGRKRVIWGSILGTLPFTLMLPYADLFTTIVLSFIIGFILASAFSAIIVYAQELIPGKTGMISGLFFGFAFGMGAMGAILLGKLADNTSLDFVYQICSFLPLIGLLTVFLPDNKYTAPSKLNHTID